MSHHHDPFRARPRALLGVASHTPTLAAYTADDVPEKATAAVAWIRDGEGDDRKARARAAEAVEEQRSEPRATVMAEVDRVLAD